MNFPGLALRADQSALQRYNLLVLQHQDEVYSLAFDLLGDERAADALVQAAFVQGFARRAHERPPFRLRALRWVVQACLDRRGPLPGPARLDSRLAGLANEPAVALILVERLGLSCAESALVMGMEMEEFRSVLAEGRVSILKMG
jgi:DNA-directed RNA polymerase specialized sigma24 family protein